MLRKIFRWWRDYIRHLNRKKRYFGLLVHFVVTLGASFLIFTLATVFVIGITTVKGQSMEPTLYENDRLVTFKLYRFLHDLVGANYVPRRGEIIVFSKKDISDQLLIKRVVGLPGERVVIKNKVITIYNREFPQGFEFDFEFKNELSDFYEDENINVHVKRGELFVLGDNLSVSTDSRVTGNILIENISGKLIMRTWPLSKLNFF